MFHKTPVKAIIIAKFLNPPVAALLIFMTAKISQEEEGKRFLLILTKDLN